MAKSTITITTRVVLDLNVNEAKYLHDLLQNPPCGVSPADEPADEQEARSAIWSELNNCIQGIKYHATI